MKTTLFLVAMLTTFSFSIAQPVQRTMVMLEKATGTWCGWCPSAAQGCEDLLEAGAPIAVVSNHNGDSYENQYSSSRNSMYAITGYPTAVFDGKEKSIGGSSTGSTVGAYAPIVQNHMVEMCPLSISMVAEPSDGNYHVTVTITKLDEITAADLRLMFFVTESHIPQIWMGLTEVNHVNRLMVPDQAGTPFDFSSGDVVTIELDVILGATWVEENCEFIACVQNADAGQPGGSWVKSIFNGIKRGVVDLTADFEASVTSIEVSDPVSFTSEYNGGYIGPVPVTYHWDFPGATPDTSNEANPVVTYTQSGYHDVTFTINKGGQVLEVIKEDYIFVAPGVGMEDPSTILAMNCYPNPSHGQFTLEVYPGEQTLIDLEIMDVMNNLIYQERGITVAEHFKTTLNPGLAPGVYFLIVKSGTHTLVKKLIIQ